MNDFLGMYCSIVLKGRKKIKNKRNLENLPLQHIITLHMGSKLMNNAAV